MTTINKQVAAGADNCYEIDDTTIQMGNSSVHAGRIGTQSMDMGLRWQTINIPQGTTITSATLSINLTNDNGALSADVRGIDEDNTAEWSVGSRPSQRTKTTATITANEANWGNWGVGNWITIDITSAIQEIINRVGWSANNALAVVLENTDGAETNYISARAYEYTGHLHGAKLDIVYSGTSIPVMMHHLQQQRIS